MRLVLHTFPYCIAHLSTLYIVSYILALCNLEVFLLLDE